MINFVPYLIVVSDLSLRYPQWIATQGWIPSIAYFIGHMSACLAMGIILAESAMYRKENI